MQAITRNSVYNITPVANGFLVRRIADLWGRAVRESHTHVTRRLSIAIGEPLKTDYMETSPVRAVVPYAHDA